MENAADALYMGFAIIAFVVALSISIFSFSEVTSASQSIINARDKTTLYNYVVPDGTARTVKREDIIPTLYRAYYENYAIKFVNIPEIEDGIYKVRVEEKDALGNRTIEYKATNIIDLESQQIGNHEDADKLITALLQGEFDKLLIDNPTRFSYFGYLQNVKLYDILGGDRQFKEEIGIYYMEDKNSTTNSGVEDVNKTTKRIITYTYEKD